jgi:c-di-GMP-binding flagellar brake protein YcgR
MKTVILADDYYNAALGCCGIRAHAGLSVLSEDEEDLVNDIVDFDGDLRMYSHQAHLVSTNNGQKEEAKRLKQLRFKAVAKFRNPRTGNMITIWLKKPAKVKSKKGSRRG